jgi:hypothetical protein
MARMIWATHEFCWHAAVLPSEQVPALMLVPMAYNRCAKALPSS